jgi:hypothetical protein
MRARRGLAMWVIPALVAVCVAATTCAVWPVAVGWAEPSAGPPAPGEPAVRGLAGEADQSGGATDQAATVPIIVNGGLLSLTATLTEGRAWVPVRVLMETLGYTVTWDDATHSVRVAGAAGASGSGATTGAGSGAGLELVGTYRFADAAGCYRIVGEVRNPGAATAYGPRVTALLWDADGRLLDTVSAPVLVEKIEGGGVAPFALVSPVTAATVAAVELRLDLQTRYVVGGAVGSSAGGAGGEVRMDVVWLGRYRADDGVTFYKGAVVNVGTATARAPRVVLTGLNAAGVAVAAETVLLPGRELPPGSMAVFEVPITANADLVTMAKVRFEWK